MKENIRVLNEVTSCKNCYFRNDCWKQRVCESYKPIDSDLFCESIYQYIKKNVKPSGEKKLKRHVYQMSRFGTYSDKETMDYFYVNFINDGVSELRKHHTIYAFSINQIIEFYRLQPELRILKYDNNGIYYLSL